MSIIITSRDSGIGLFPIDFTFGILGATFQFVGSVFKFVGNILWYSFTTIPQQITFYELEPTAYDIANQNQNQNKLVLFESSDMFTCFGIGGLLFGSTFIEDRDFKQFFQYSTYGIMGLLILNKLRRY